MMGRGAVHYEVGGYTEATSYGGVAAVHRLATRLGLVEQLDARLHLLKVHLPYHESDHVLNIAYNVLCGGTRLEDLELRRGDLAYLNALDAELLPDPTTAGDFCRRFRDQDQVTALQEAINAVRPQLWRGRAQALLSPIAYLDIDGTIVPTEGERKLGMEMSYQGIWGYAPLLNSLANTKEPLYLINRPGNVPSHTDAARWIDAAIALVQPHTPRVCLRGDTDFSLTTQFDRWAAQVDFIFGMDCSRPLHAAAEGLDETAWQRLDRPASYQPLTAQPRDRERCQPHEKDRLIKERGYLKLTLQWEHVAEFSYQPGACQRPYRVIALRKNISRQKGEQALFDEIRYFFYITTRTDLTAAEVVFCANDRCDQENLIEQLKNGVRALRVPVYDLISNNAYMVMAALAWSLKAWFALMMHQLSERQRYLRMEFPRFLHSVILIPCRVVRRARGITLRLLGYRPTVERLISAWQTIERLRFG